MPALEGAKAGSYRSDGGAAPTAAVPSAVLSARLANGLRGLMSPAQTQCRLKRISANVQLIERSSFTAGQTHRRMTFGGVMSCKSSLCPLCAPKWQQTRASEIVEAVEHWGARRVMFATMTMRHHKGMPLALQHRILTRAFGNLWSGRAGQALVDELGGKPETIRAHDRTWSFERNWHPHIHALLFMRSEHLSVAEIEELIWQRWSGESVFGPQPEGKPSLGSLPAALRSMKRFVRRALARAAELESPWIWLGPTKSGEPLTCGHLRGCGCHDCTFERARRMFGSKLVPKSRALLDSLRQLSQLLAEFSETAIAPTRERGVQIERARDGDKASTYLAKLGLELAWSESKDVNVVDGVEHYPYWGVAHLATMHGHPLRVAARRAWSELFAATRSTQPITFSDRTALGLGPDPYVLEQSADDAPEALPGEFHRLLGEIHGATWDELKKVHKHGVLVTLQTAHAKGLIETLPYVCAPPGMSGVASSRGPPEPEARMSPLERATRIAAAEERGRAGARAQFAAEQHRDEPDFVWREELRQKLKDMGIELQVSWRAAPAGHPW